MPTKRNKTVATSPKMDPMVSASLELSKLIVGWFKRGSYPLVAIGIGAILTFSYAMALNIGLPKTGELISNLKLCFYLGTLLILGGFATAIIAGANARKTLTLGIQRYDKTIKTAQEFSKESVEAIRNLNQDLRKAHRNRRISELLA